MAKTKQAKNAQLDRFKDTFKNYSSFVLISYYGTSVASMEKIRNALKDNNANLMVTKNTLAKLAVSSSSVDQGFSNYFKGTTALAYSNDILALSKHLSASMRDNDKMIILAGLNDGKLVSKSDIEKFAAYGSVDGLRASFVGTLYSAYQSIYGLVDAYIEKQSK